jgi:hypothetical protein
MRLLTIAIALVLWTNAAIELAWGYGIPVHNALTARTVDASPRFDEVLRHDLAFPDGKLTKFLMKDAREWVRDGAGFEDKPDHRVLNHFHNPMLPWDKAGLVVLAIQWGESSVLWQQERSQDPLQDPSSPPGEGGTWSWPEARRHYNTALTARVKSRRETAFANTFRALGHLVHLIQDASVPAHVRNDEHLYHEVPLFGIVGDPDGYERWVDERVTADVFRSILAGEPVGPGPFIFTGIRHQKAPVPVSGLIDTGRYGLSRNPGILTDSNIGLAEYTNGNFLSDDTNSFGNRDVLASFPFPAPTSVELGPLENEPRRAHLRRYFRKARDGERIDHLAVPSALYNYLPDALRDKRIGLDDKVYADYMSKLIPRAVGYSAALIDYFFRGKLEAKLDSDRLVIANQTPGETMSGTFELYYDATDDTRVLIGTWPLTLGPGKSSDPLKVPPHPDGALPPARPDSYTLVFRGTLGDEEGAIAAKRFTRAELRGGWWAYLYSVSVDQSPPLTGTYVFPLFGLNYAQMWDRISLATPIGGLERIAILMPVYRNPTDLPGRRLALSVWGGCEEFWSPMLRPVRAHFVEFYEPADLEGLQRLDYENRPPGVKRVITSVDLAFDRDLGRILMTLDIGDVPFFGVRLAEYPTSYPPPSTHGTLNENRCEAGASILAVE